MKLIQERLEKNQATHTKKTFGHETVQKRPRMEIQGGRGAKLRGTQVAKKWTFIPGRDHISGFLGRHIDLWIP